MEQQINFLGMDLDSDPRAMQPGSYRKAFNVRVNNTATGSMGVVENMKGNTVANVVLPAGINEVIGTYEDKTGSSVFFFLYNSAAKHGIYQFKTVNNQVVKVFEWSGLNFRRDFRIYGVAMEGDIIFWTDNYNPPRKLNTVRAKNAEYEPLKATEKYFLNMLATPPALAPQVLKDLDADVDSNWIRSLNLQFSYRYQYWDNEFSVLAPASKVIPLARENDTDDAAKNVVKLTIPAAEKTSKMVKKVELLFRIGNIGKWQVWKTVERDAIGILERKHNFYNDAVSYGITEAEAIKPHEAIPNKAVALASVKNRIFLAGLTEGYNRPTVNLEATAVVPSSSGAISIVNREVVTYRTVGEEFAWDGNTSTWNLVISYDTSATYVLHSDGMFYPATYNFMTEVYEYAVVAADAKTGAQLSTPQVFTTPPGATANPSHETITVTSQPNQPTFQTNALATVTQYHVWRVDVDYHYYDWEAYAANEWYDGGQGTWEEYWVERGGLYYPATLKNGVYEYNFLNGGTSAIDTEPTFQPGVDSSGNVVPNPSYEHHVPTDLGLYDTSEIVPGGTIPVNVETLRIFKGASSYQVGVMYKDEGSRNAGVAKGDVKVSFPPLPTDISTMKTHIRWELKGAPLQEIPDWATSFHIVRTKNQSMATFVQGKTGDVVYSERQEDGSFTYSRAYANQDVISINVGTLNYAEIGYVYTPGDRIKLEIAGGIHDLEITGQHGKFVETPIKNLGALANPAVCRFEIYTPYKPGENEPFYEVGEAYPIINPGTSNRDYSVKSGNLEGDCWLLNRVINGSNGKAYVEATSRNDRFWSDWDSDLGRITARIPNSKVAFRKSAIRFGNTYVQESQTNGLCEFEPLNEQILDLSHGAVCFLQAVSNVLLIFQEHETISAYIGEQQFMDANGQTLIAVSDKILGSSRPLRGSWGCSDPGSIRENDGYVYWYCRAKKSILRYANDGVTPISGYGIESFLNSLDNSFIYVRSYIDPLNGEYAVCFQTVNQEQEAPGDGGGGEDLFMMGDSGAAYAYHSLVFQEKSNRWTTFLSFDWEEAQKVGKQVLLTFKEGQPWIHETNDYGLFYGQARKASIQPVCNQFGEINKIFMRVRQESDALWQIPVMVTMEGQESELLEIDFTEYESQWCADILRDKHTPNLDYPLVEGDVMRSAWLMLTLENTSDSRVQLKSLHVGFEKS